MKELYEKNALLTSKLNAYEVLLLFMVLIIIGLLLVALPVLLSDKNTELALEQNKKDLQNQYDYGYQSGKSYCDQAIKELALHKQNMGDVGEIIGKKITCDTSFSKTTQYSIGIATRYTTDKITTLITLDNNIECPLYNVLEITEGTKVLKTNYKKLKSMN